jgi:uncharacterized repeat protein (TIGR03806 family)
MKSRIKPKNILAVIAMVITVSSIFSFTQRPGEEVFQWPVTLSEWQLFEAPLSELKPAEGVILYSVNAPLYSDYAHKSRFIRLPGGRSMQYHPTQVFDMPDETVLIKNFFYLNDEREPAKGKRVLETRLIVKHEGIWHAMTYRWNAEQSEARRAIAGGSTDVSWIDGSGKQQQLHYLIPDVNQCKNCHNRNDTFVPLGIVARQLNNPDMPNQLMQWEHSGILAGVTTSFEQMERLVDYSDNSNSLESRARSYLDANCAHCHSSEGSARTSGLHLDYHESNPHAWGVMKSPVAAGRGSGGLQYNIVPGKPQQSILLYRMESSDPGVRMPEINRQLSHEEGIALIKDWIRNMKE